MNVQKYRFIEPLDVLFLRGNKLFGDPGSYGESLVPPWPSVAAGAFRSRMLADDRVDLSAYAAGQVLHATLGTPKTPGLFRVIRFQIARRKADGSIELLFSPPADLVMNAQECKVTSVRLLKPTMPALGIWSSSQMSKLPVLAESERSKLSAGFWLTEAGWNKYLSGEQPLSSDLIGNDQLWCIDQRVGVGLESDTGRAVDGRLFSMQAVTMKPDVGFLVGVSGAVPPDSGMVRFGGDGRAARIYPATPNIKVSNYADIVRSRSCRLVLATPGIFSEGWKLPGVFSDNRFKLGNVSGRLVCAAIPRAEVISGWDLAKWQPKSAKRAAPAGSVYWLDELDATPEALDKLVEDGLWNEPCEDRHRRAEGFNQIYLASWH